MKKYLDIDSISEFMSATILIYSPNNWIRINLAGTGGLCNGKKIIFLTIIEKCGCLYFSNSWLEIRIIYAVVNTPPKKILQY